MWEISANMGNFVQEKREGTCVFPNQGVTAIPPFSFKAPLLSDRLRNQRTTPNKESATMKNGIPPLL